MVVFVLFSFLFDSFLSLAMYAQAHTSFYDVCAQSTLLLAVQSRFGEREVRNTAKFKFVTWCFETMRRSCRSTLHPKKFSALSEQNLHKKSDTKKIKLEFREDSLSSGVLIYASFFVLL